MLFRQLKCIFSRCLLFVCIFFAVLSYAKPFFSFYFLQKNKEEAILFCGERMVSYISVSGYGCKK